MVRVDLTEHNNHILGFIIMMDRYYNLTDNFEISQGDFVTEIFELSLHITLSGEISSERDQYKNLFAI